MFIFVRIGASFTGIMFTRIVAVPAENAESGLSVFLTSSYSPFFPRDVPSHALTTIWLLFTPFSFSTFGFAKILVCPSALNSSARDSDTSLISFQLLPSSVE